MDWLQKLFGGGRRTTTPPSREAPLDAVSQEWDGVFRSAMAGFERALDFAESVAGDTNRGSRGSTSPRTTPDSLPLLGGRERAALSHVANCFSCQGSREELLSLSRMLARVAGGQEVLTSVSGATNSSADPEQASATSLSKAWIEYDNERPGLAVRWDDGLGDGGVTSAATALQALGRRFGLEFGLRPDTLETRVRQDLAAGKRPIHSSGCPVCDEMRRQLAEGGRR